MENRFYKIESSRVWKFLKNNAGAITALCAVLALIVSIVIPSMIRDEKTYTAGVRNPKVKIKSVRLKTFPYQDGSKSGSVALKFYVTIKNEGSAIAYDVDIMKKEIKLVRGHYNLDDISLQSMYTSTPFNLKPNEIIEDNIFIDENPEYLQKVLNGNKSFVLKYKIQFYADETQKKEPYTYQYESKFSNGKFQVISESLHQDIKP